MVFRGFLVLPTRKIVPNLTCCDTPLEVSFLVCFVWVVASHIVLALSSAVTNLSKITLNFPCDFQRLTITEFHDISGLENESFKFHDFPGFP